MKNLSFNFLFPLAGVVMLIIVLDRSIFMVPPLGTTVNPFIGFVQNESDIMVDKTIDLNTKSQIEIIFDERRVSHIFATSQEDLFFAQGYVCASERLWQMDFISYISAGRLSEIFGKEFLDHDRIQRRIGMVQAAESSLVFIEQNEETKLALDNYTKGVNALINTLSYANMPIEYKLMNYEPEPWTNLKSVLIMKYMSALLSGYEEDISSSYLKSVLGNDYDKLFTDFIIHENRDSFEIDFLKDTLTENGYLDYKFLEASPEITPSQFNPRLGSNSWAISPQKSSSGNAILCSDPHLNLNLPAIWYEIQLISNQQNVYGYSIPGVPGVVIGYNEKISWGLTNGATDVRDYYKLELNADYSRYKYDEKWISTQVRYEEIKVKGEENFIDTVYYTHHGPIVSDYRFGTNDLKGFAIDWSLHDPSNEFLTFIKINKAANYDNFKDAISHYKCPVQNFSYADVEGNIAIHHQGQILESDWKDQGKFVLDGTKSSHDARKPLSTVLPFLYNPKEGYVFSANNNPYGVMDSTMLYGYYSELRANKINSELSSKPKFSIADMKKMQLNNVNRFSELAIPVLLKFFSENEKNVYIQQMRKWDYLFDKDSKLALIFESWWTHIKNNTWDELVRFKRNINLPDNLVLLDMISDDPKNEFFDVLTTETVEDGGDIVRKSFEQIWENIGIHQSWGSLNCLNIHHLSNLPEFGRLGISTGGHPDAINAMAKNWGPSLRMIVEMSDRPKGIGIYAGGQSGNPVSANYDQFISDWVEGSYYECNFFENKNDAAEKKICQWILN